MKVYRKGYIEKLEHYIYLVEHPKFKGWLKLGRTTDLKNRLNQYNTGCPHRKYKYVYHLKVDNKKVLLLIENYFKINIHNNGFEWFKCTKEEAIITIEKLSIHK